jgi:hypothetical protein
MDKHKDDNAQYLSRLMHYRNLFPSPVQNQPQNAINNYIELKKPNIYQNFDSSQWASMRSLAVSTARGMKGTLDGYAATQKYELKDVALYQS